MTVSVCLLAIVCTAAGKIIYVDDNAIGANEGSSWADAYNYLQDALADANSSEKPVEIRVAQGIYRPDQGGGNKPGDTHATFRLKNGVVLKGGYAGFGEVDPNARNTELHKTILSGDLAGNDVAVNDPLDLYGEPSRVDNSLHVLTCGSDIGDTPLRRHGVSSTIAASSGTDSTAVLDGFTIAGGQALPVHNDMGAGLLNRSGSLMVIDCAFVHNSAFAGGGGMYNDNSNPTLVDCVFTGNSAGSGSGGGMRNKGSNPTVTNCVFIGNSAFWDGGGIANFEFSRPNITNCRFVRNSARHGGGIHNHLSSPTLAHCVFGANSAAEYGGAIYNYYASHPTLRNCTFVGNSAQNGNAITWYSYRELSNVQLINCILWDGRDEISNHDGSTIIISYCDVRGGHTAVHDPCEGLIWGEGNTDADPCFADPGYWDPNGTPEDANDDVWVDGDYHLKSQTGRWDANEARWTKEDVTSPCIDAGNPMSAIGHEPFPNGGIINMGAYGGTAEASKSYFGKATCETIIAGDINGDCVVNYKDFTFLALHWLTDNSP